MSTSDRQGNDVPLTRKQLREIRLTGATPVITPEDVAAAAPPAPVPPRPAEPVQLPPATPPPSTTADGAAAPHPLTRRQVRELQRGHGSAPTDTASMPATPEADEAPAERSARTPTPAVSEPSAGQEPVALRPVAPGTTPAGEVVAAEVVETPASEPPASEPGAAAPAAAAPIASVPEPAEPTSVHADGELSEAEQAEQERPVVSPTFGQSVLEEQNEVPTFTPSFDELITTDTTGSHHVAPSTLIFTPGEGSLSGPVASTGEILVTGSYELPDGIGSQGHARGTADGKEVDSVLIDGELPAASSPTPIAASAAVSTIKPAGEVIRPPAPEKGSKLMLTLAITAGGLAIAVAVVLVVAFTTNIF